MPTLLVLHGGSVTGDETRSLQTYEPRMGCGGAGAPAAEHLSVPICRLPGAAQRSVAESKADRHSSWVVN